MKICNSIRNTIVVCLFVVLSGCASQTTREVVDDGLPSDAARADEVRDLQTALVNRGLYMTSDGVIAFESKNHCNGWEVEAHRGHPDYPENSVLSVYQAIKAGADVVEIDIMLVGSWQEKTWVLHHDKVTGRAIAHSTRTAERVRNLKLHEFLSYRHKNSETGELTSLRPSVLHEVLEVFRGHARPGQALHIEIKGKADERNLFQLDSMVRRYLNAGQYHYSSFNYGYLKVLRSVNDHVYLGVIQEPNPHSLNSLKKTVDTAAAGDPLYQRYSGWLDLGLRWNRRDTYFSGVTLDKLVRELGLNAGVHWDVRDAVLHSSAVDRAQAKGLRVATYSINGQEYHESRLQMALERGAKPDAVIIDETPYGFCPQWSPLRRKGPLENATESARFFDALPLDADFRALDDMMVYLPNGLYMALDGEIKPVNQPASFVEVDASAPDLDVGPRQREERFDLEEGGPMIIPKEVFE